MMKKMEEILPRDLVFDIFCRLPIKSLLRCKCVCHSWRILIKDPTFTHMHLARSSLNHCITTALVMSNKSDSIWLLDLDGITTLDDGSHHHHHHHHHQKKKKKKKKGVSLSKMRDYQWPIRQGLRIFCSCNGLLCFTDGSNMYICNPVTSEYMLLPPSPLMGKNFDLKYGMGFDAASRKYKVVRIFKYGDDGLDAEVYTLGSSSSWRHIGKVPHQIGRLSYQHYEWKDTRVQFIDGAIHWLAVDSILSMNMENEEFKHLSLPQTCLEYKMIEWKGRLGLLEKGLNCSFTDVWVLEDPKGKMMSWRKDLTILRNLPLPLGKRYKTIGIQKDGEILLTCWGSLTSYNLQRNVLRMIDISSLYPCPLYVELVAPVASLVSITSSSKIGPLWE